MGFLVRAEGIFVGAKTCKNEDYMILKFKFPEYYKGSIISPDNFQEANCNMLIRTQDWSVYQDLTPTQKYLLALETKTEKANEKYPAKVAFNICKIESKVA